MEFAGAPCGLIAPLQRQGAWRSCHHAQTGRAGLCSTHSCHLSTLAAPQPLNARSLSARRPPLTPRKDKACSMPAAASSGVKASGGRAKSEGVAHVFGFPTRLRCVDVHVIVSDTVKGSHIQRSPLSMGAQRVSQRRAISKSKKRRDCAGSLCVRCNSASGLTLGGSVPMRCSPPLP